MDLPSATNSRSTTADRTEAQRSWDELRPSLGPQHEGDGAAFARVAGIVIPRDRRGRELGFPTANVAPDSVTNIQDGVFAGTVLREDGTLHRAAISVGTRETFYSPSAERLIEA
jgi:hypothetical protein